MILLDVVCRSCGKMLDVNCAVDDSPRLTAADHQGFEIDEAEVVYWGTCPDCQDDETTHEMAGHCEDQN